MAQLFLAIRNLQKRRYTTGSITDLRDIFDLQCTQATHLPGAD